MGALVCFISRSESYAFKNYQLPLGILTCKLKKNYSMPLEFVKSQWGKDLLVHGGFIYKKDREGKEKMKWICNKIKNCPGRAHTPKIIIL